MIIMIPLPLHNSLSASSVKVMMQHKMKKLDDSDVPESCMQGLQEGRPPNDTYS